MRRYTITAKLRLGSVFCLVAFLLLLAMQNVHVHRCSSHDDHRLHACRHHLVSGPGHMHCVACELIYTGAATACIFDQSTFQPDAGSAPATITPMFYVFGVYCLNSSPRAPPAA